MSYFLPGDHDLKYSAATPNKNFDSICRTIKSGSPTDERIIADIDRIKDSTLHHIIEANGTYIDDSCNKKSRHGVRLAKEQEERKKSNKAIKSDPALKREYDTLLQHLWEGKVQVPCKFEEDEGVAADEWEEDHWVGDFISVPAADMAEDDDLMEGEASSFADRSNRFITHGCTADISDADADADADADRTDLTARAST
jgi:hypothetical protein